MKLSLRNLYRKANSIYLFALITLIGTSCKPLSRVGNHNIPIEPVTKNGFKKLNGTYSNSFDTSFGKINHYPGTGQSDYERLTILNQLFHNYPETAWRDKNNKYIDPKEKWIKIEFQSKNLAIISMYHNEDSIFSKKIHGKVQNGYFYLRPKVYIFPLVPLIFGYNFERVRIGKTIDNSLILEHNIEAWAFALFAGGEDHGAASSIYRTKSK